MKQLAEFFSELGYTRIALIILLLGIFIDITPAIKFNPIKAIFKYLGKSFNSSVEKEISDFKLDVNKQIGEVKSEQTTQRETLDKIILDNSEKELSRLRWAVIDFRNSIVNGEKHSREQYRHILDSLEKYDQMIDDSNEVDEYYHTVQEDGEKIRRHYEAHKDDPVLFF